MSDEKKYKPSDGSTSENLIKFRVSTDDKEKIRGYFGSFSAIRDYVLELIDDKGDEVTDENKQ